MLIVDYDPETAGRSNVWTDVSIDVTVGSDTETFTVTTERNRLSVWLALIDWYESPSRAWYPSSGTALAWYQTTTGGPDFYKVTAFPFPLLGVDSISVSAAWIELMAADDGPEPPDSLWPDSGVDLQRWRRQIPKGNGGASGAALAGVLGERRTAIRAVLDATDMTGIGELLRVADSPRMAWVLQLSTGPHPLIASPPNHSATVALGTWRRVALGEVKIQRTGLHLWSLEAEVGGDALGLPEGP